MTHALPLIRAAAIMPMRRWFEERNEDIGPFLDAADLGWVPPDDPVLPVPLRSVVRLLVEISRAHGPDAPHRIVEGRGSFEIGLIGRVAFYGPTVRDGFALVSRTIAAHCTHEVFTVADLADGLHVRDGWTYDLGNDEALHLVQQYVASLIDMACSVAHPATPRASKVSLLPHPEMGLSHLRDWLGDQLYPAPNRALDFVIRPEVAAAHFPDAVRERAKQLDADTEKRAICGRTLQEQVATLISAMLSRTAPDLDRVAAAAGISGRTLRRALQQDRIRYSDLVDRTRAQIGLDRIRMDTDVPLKSIAKDLGYAHQATLSRAIRRWTGEAPSNLQKHGRDAHDGG